SFDEGLLDRRPRDVLDGGARQHLQAVEVLAPLLGHRLRVAQVLLVQLLDERRIAAEEVRVVEELPHAGCHGATSCRAASHRAWWVPCRAGAAGRSCIPD